MATSKAAKSKSVRVSAKKAPLTPAAKATKPATTARRSQSAKGFSVGQPATQRTKLPAQTFEQIAARLRAAAA